MNNKFEKPEVEVIEVDGHEIVTTSIGDNRGGDFKENYDDLFGNN